MTKYRISGEHIWDGYREIIFDTLDSKWLNIEPQEDNTGKYINVNLSGESIWVKADTFKMEIIEYKEEQ